jgi:cell division protein FtsB
MSAASTASRPVPSSSTTTIRRPARDRSPGRPNRRASAPRRPAASTPRARVQVVAPTRARPKRAPFVGLIVFLLAGGLLTLLLLNMVLAQDAFKVTQLQAQVAVLQDRQEALAQNVERLGAPDQLAARARELGMVVSQNPVFLRTTNGAVVGVPSPGGYSSITRSAQPTEPNPVPGGSLPDVTPPASQAHR